MTAYARPPLRRPVPALLAPVLLATVLSGCGALGGGTATRYLVDTAPSAAAPAPAPVRLRVSTIELRDVVLPAHGEGTQILVEGADGGLTPIPGGQWADGSARGITTELARHLDLRGTATVAAEPWPLADPAQIRVEVRIERLLARADGRFQLSGQYAVSAPDGHLREFIERFDLLAPMPEGRAPAAAVAQSYGQALSLLGDQILARLARR